MTKSDLEASTWKLSSPSAILTGVLAAFMLFLAVRSVVDPWGAANGYGIALSARGDVPWLYVKAGRDLGVAVALGAFLALRERRTVGVLVLANT